MRILTELFRRGYRMTTSANYDEASTVKCLEQLHVHTPEYLRFLQNVWPSYLKHRDPQFHPTPEGLVPVMIAPCSRFPGLFVGH